MSFPFKNYLLQKFRKIVNTNNVDRNGVSKQNTHTKHSEKG